MLDFSRVDKKVRQKESFSKYLKNTPEARLYLSSKASARTRGIEHNLTVLDIRSIMVDTCPLLGVKLTNITGEGKGPRHDANPSIDRIDNSKGYVKGNVQIISTLANKMKQDADRETLLNFAIGIISMYKVEKAR